MYACGLRIGEVTRLRLADLLKRVKSKSSIEARANAIMELAEFGPKALPALPDLLDALQTKNEDLRLSAALTLLFGSDAVVCLRDIAGLDRDEAIETLAWAARQLTSGLTT